MPSTVATTGDKRPQVVALLGFLLTLASLVILAVLAVQQTSHLMDALCRLVAVGLLIWLAVNRIFKQVRRVGAEALETAELQRARQTGTSSAMFDVDDEGLLLEQSRLQWMVRWILPTVTIILSFKLLVGHFVKWDWTLQNAFDKGVFLRTAEPTLVMWFVVGIGFANFLYARYSLALSKLPGWRLLHAGGVCMAANAFACLLTAIALMSTGSLTWAEPLVAYIIRIALLVLGAELAVNFILDFYRPRVRGEIPRPSFDSRLLGLISEPGGIAKSIADAVNYQFGFEVSSTWFYQLLQRWFFPITVFTFLVVLLLTSVVVVDAGEEAMVERWGRPLQSGQNVLTPGLHFKWPYPIDVVHRAPSRRINEIVLGEATEEEDHDARKAIVWTEAHDYVPELMVLVASPKSIMSREKSAPVEAPQASATTSESQPVGLLMLSVPIHYRVKDTEKYLYRFVDPVKLLEDVAYQYLCDYAASVDIDVLMGPGREKINGELKGLIQKRVDELDAGIEIVFAGIRAAHPPARDQVAATFQKVISAQTGMASMINAAHGEARKILINAAGTESQAKALDEAIRTREALREGASTNPDEAGKAEARIEELLLGNSAGGVPPLGGRASAMIANARASAREHMSEALMKARSFQTDVVAYLAAPELFRMRKILELYANIDLVRKYVIVGDPSKVVIEYDQQEAAGLDRVLSEAVDKERKAKGNK